MQGKDREKVDRHDISPTPPFIANLKLGVIHKWRPPFSGNENRLKETESTIQQQFVYYSLYLKYAPHSQQSETNCSIVLLKGIKEGCIIFHYFLQLMSVGLAWKSAAKSNEKFMQHCSYLECPLVGFVTFSIMAKPYNLQKIDWSQLILRNQIGSFQNLKNSFYLTCDLQYIHDVLLTWYKIGNKIVLS